MGAQHENLVSEILIKLSRRNDVRVWKNATGKARALGNNQVLSYGLVGSSDILGIIAPHGRMLCIECKVGSDKQRPEQLRFQTMIEERGGLYILARSLEDVKW